jgi:hypothetical protein
MTDFLISEEGATLNWSPDLDNIFYGSDGTEYYLDCILLNLVASTIPKWRTFKFLRWSQFINRLVDLDEVLYGIVGVKCYLDYILFNPIASTIPEWRASNFWGECNFWNDWWIWMEFCMELMELNIVYCKLM